MSNGFLRSSAEQSGSKPFEIGPGGLPALVCTFNEKLKLNLCTAGYAGSARFNKTYLLRRSVNNPALLKSMTIELGSGTKPVRLKSSQTTVYAP